MGYDRIRPSPDIESNLKSGIVRGGRSVGLPFIILYRFVPMAVRAAEDAIPILLIIDLFKVVLLLVHLLVSVRFISLVFRDRASLLTSTPS